MSTKDFNHCRAHPRNCHWFHVGLLPPFTLLYANVWLRRPAHQRPEALFLRISCAFNLAFQALSGYL
jgi:hypothetical protein